MTWPDRIPLELTEEQLLHLRQERAVAWLARLEDRVFEGMTAEDAKGWPRRFSEAVPVGVSLDGLADRLAIRRLREECLPLSGTWPKSVRAQVVAAIEQTIAALEGKDEDQRRSAWWAAASAARSASAAWWAAAAESAARSASAAWWAAAAAAAAWWAAAESAAESAASAASAAESAASAAESAARSAEARSAAYRRESDRIVEELLALRKPSATSEDVNT
jgi:hypothetical protein